MAYISSIGVALSAVPWETATSLTIPSNVSVPALDAPIVKFALLSGHAGVTVHELYALISVPFKDNCPVLVQPSQVNTIQRAPR